MEVLLKDGGRQALQHRPEVAMTLDRGEFRTIGAGEGGGERN